VPGARVAKLLRDVSEPAVRQPEFLQPVGIVGIQVGQLLEDGQGLGVGLLRGGQVAPVLGYVADLVSGGRQVLLPVGVFGVQLG
jgi:hypothetical protein